MVIDEGVLFRTNEDAFVKTKRKLTDDCDPGVVAARRRVPHRAAGVKTNLLFFTKGQPTEPHLVLRPLDVKVGKKTPLTVKNFDDFFARLPTRDDSERSWTIDLTARKEKAAADAQPFKDTARAKGDEAEVLRARLGELKKAKPRDEGAVGEAEVQLATILKEFREATAKAEAIENAVYDLKAVNPNRKAVTDTRTPADLLDLIESKGREIADALAALRNRVP
ncbi:MAG: hypothetical protein U0804_00390 [Gemmataceae bacterium]